MEYFNGILCISSKELIRTDINPDGLISKGVYDYWIHYRKHIKIIRRGCNETPTLIEFDSLPSKFRQLVKYRFGDQEVASGTENIMKYLSRDKKAVRFFRNYRVGGENKKSLPDAV